MKKNVFKIIFDYLKDQKLNLILYLILMVLTYIPVVLSTFFYGYAIEALMKSLYSKFMLFLILRESSYIVFYILLAIPRDLIYKKLEILFTKRVTKDLYTKISNMPSIAFENMGVGEFINRLTTDPDRVIELLGKLIKMICRFISVIFVLIIAFNSSLILGVEILIFSIIMGYVSYKFFPKIKSTQEEIKKDTDKIVKSATENITGIREIKALGIKENIENRLFKNIDKHFYDYNKIRNYELGYWNINGFIYYVLQFIILATSGYLVVKGNLTYALFIVIESNILKIDAVVESISDFGINYNKVKVSLNRIDSIVNNRLYTDEKFGNIEINNITGNIKFDNVKFKYTKDDDYVLNGLNLDIEPNKKIAIVGKSGNGKSTIFNLLLRYFDNTEGSITIDGVNIKDLTEQSLRNNISVIRQFPFLFNTSVIDNFRLLDENVTLERVRDVCKKAYIDDYIMSLPNKYDTIIGEGGVNLSGGQKQRLAIARTLLKNTKIILFDEATSALDNESEKYIKLTIDNLVKDHTVIIVAHRLSTIIDADTIYVIDKGKLVNQGNHKYLLDNCDIYKNLYKMEGENEKSSRRI